METRTNRGLLFEISTPVWNGNARKPFYRRYFSPEVDTWPAWWQLVRPQFVLVSD